MWSSVYGDLAKIKVLLRKNHTWLLGFFQWVAERDEGNAPIIEGDKGDVH